MKKINTHFDDDEVRTPIIGNKWKEKSTKKIVIIRDIYYRASPQKVFIHFSEPYIGLDYGEQTVCLIDDFLKEFEEVKE